MNMYGTSTWMFHKDVKLWKRERERKQGVMWGFILKDNQGGRGDKASYDFLHTKQLISAESYLLLVLQAWWGFPPLKTKRRKRLPGALCFLCRKDTCAAWGDARQFLLQNYPCVGPVLFSFFWKNKNHNCVTATSLPKLSLHLTHIIPPPILGITT